MKRFQQHLKPLTVFLSLLTLEIALTACGAVLQQTSGFGFSESGQAKSAGNIDISNGELIYYRAINNDGERIRYSDGPRSGGMMMGSYLTCASCHGPEARGGQHRMHMTVMNSPDIRVSALISEGDEHGTQEDAHREAHGEYDLEAFRMAVIGGKHPGGELLRREMPRWRINDQDLQDLFEFLKSIP